MFTCNNCHCCFSKIDDFCQHQKMHSMQSNSVIVCPSGSCQKIFKNYDNFKKHIHRMHKNVIVNYRHSVNYSCKEISCNYQSLNLFLFKKHLYNHLSLFSKGISCPFPNCPTPERIFKSKSIYASHLSLKHRNLKEYLDIEECPGDKASSIRQENEPDYYEEERRKSQ